MTSFCTYCQQDFTENDKPVRANAGALGKWAHAGCKPVSGSYAAAGWRVTVTESVNRNVPAGLTKRFVHGSKARSYAASLEAFGGVTCTVSEI